jgi:hypothetical protein
MTLEPTLLTTLVLADDAEFFELLRGVEKTDCTRCQSNERVKRGQAWTGKDGVRREQRTCGCGWSWSVPVDTGDLS